MDSLFLPLFWVVYLSDAGFACLSSEDGLLLSDGERLSWISYGRWYGKF